MQNGRASYARGALLVRSCTSTFAGFPDMRQIVHAGLTGIMFWFSYAMLSPRTEMAGPVWNQFLALASEEQWGWLFLGAGMIGLFGLLSGNIWVNTVCTFLLATAHGCMAICFYCGGIHPPEHEIPTAVGTYAIIAAMGYALTLRRLLVAGGVVEERILVINIRAP